MPSRHLVLASPIRALRTRLPSLRSVLPSRQIVLNEIFCPRIARIFVQASQKTELVRVMPSAAENVKEIGTLIDLGVKCLEFSCKRAQSRTCSGYAERSRKSQRRGTTPKDRFPVTHSDTKILLLFHQSQTNVIAFFLSAQSVILPFAIFTLLLFRKF